MGCVPGADESLATGGQAGLAGGVAMLLRADSRDVLRDPQSGGGPVGVCTRRGVGADEQRGGAGAAARGDLAAGQWGNRQRAWEPVRGADVDSGRDVPSARPERPGLPDLVL